MFRIYAKILIFSKINIQQLLLIKIIFNDIVKLINLKGYLKRLNK